MKSIPESEAIHRVSEITAILEDGGIACFPINGTYRLVADALDEGAVTRLMQTKRRAHNHPSLVLVADNKAARGVVHGMAWPMTKTLTERFWPGSLTLALPPSNDLPPKVRKLLSRATGTIGVRVSADPLASAVVRAIGRPLITSSANLEKKPGASSAATVQRSLSSVDVWVDAGDIKPGAASTILALSESGYKLVREGALAKVDIDRALEPSAA